ncbi:hypothetical protein EII29_01330 [Leptotrichia sp. OH3620_COT-345]|uniref:hypothetical protein n=1 Tax=Leptotrichia sp. OH3620_COT-345 TaxID=2491048 RepID=UPI000F6475BB|nr:hypothetical protein [Leptotrichia sp. OH3620_COT-345]RRD40612.1 hypothetical protein EII29_01330 [Leptotrichia sp. OH3620_COT-345]
MKEGKVKNIDEKFREYFRKTFCVDKKNLIQSYNEEDIDLEYNFKAQKYIISKNIFETIYINFSEGKYEQLGPFFSNLKILSENKGYNKVIKYESNNIKENKRGRNGDSYFEREEEYYQNQKEEFTDKNLEKLYSERNKFLKMDFKNIGYFMGTLYPHKLYTILNESQEKSDKIILTEMLSYDSLADNYEKKRQEMKNKEIMSLQKLYSSEVKMFNKIFFEEFVSDVLKHGAENILKSYMFPFFSFPKKILFCEGSSDDLTDTVFKIYENERLYNIIKDKKDFKFEYDNVKRNLKKEFYYTDFDKINRIDKLKDNFQIKTLDTYTEILDFNSNDYLKEYRQLKPFLDRYNMKKMTSRNLKKLYKDNERLFKNLEKKLGKSPSDTTKNMILNKLIINEFMKKKMKGKTYIVIDDTENPFFGLKVPVINGKINVDFINMEFDILNQESRSNLIKTAERFADNRGRIVNQLIKTEDGIFDFNDTDDEIRNLIFNKIGIEPEEVLEDIITNIEELENILNENSSDYIFNGINYEFSSRLDRAVIKIIDPLLTTNHENIEKVVSHINENSIIKESRDICDDDLEEFSENISENPYFKIEKADLYKLKQNKNQINKMISRHVPAGDIVEKYKFKDKSNMAFILGAFKQSFSVNRDGKIFKDNLKVEEVRESSFRRSVDGNENLDVSFKDSFFEDEPDLKILRGQSNYIQNKALEFSEMIKEAQEKIDFFNLKNQEIFNENFDNIIKNKSKINLIKEIEKTKIDIENIKFFGQNIESMKKSNLLKTKLRTMENKLTSTMAVEILMKNKIIEEKYKDILRVTDRFYIEVLKDLIKEKWEVLLRDYYTDTELLRNDIVINPKLNYQLKREIEYSFGFYNTAGVEEKVEVLNRIMGNLDIKRINKDFLNEKRKKAANLEKKLLRENQTELNENNRKMHALLNRDIEKLEKMDEETKKTVNRFADRFINRLESESEDGDFSEKFSLNKFSDREFIDYIIKYENVDNSYIRELLAIDGEGTFVETDYHNQSFQELNISDRFARYRGQMKINTLRKSNLTGRKVFENNEIKRFRNNRKKLNEEIEEVKSRIKEILSEIEREYEEDMRKIGQDRKESLQNQEKTKEKLNNNKKITVMKAVEIKKEEERTEAEREHEEDMEKIREEKEEATEYVREMMNY